jgi:hypothetical protein
MHHTELKALQVQLNNANAEHAVAMEAQRNASIEADRALKKVKSLKKKLDEHAASAVIPTISEHALLRLLERVYGIDMEELKAKVMTPTTIKAIKAIKSGTVPLETGGRAIIKNHVIVSITD